MSNKPIDKLIGKLIDISENLIPRSQAQPGNEENEEMLAQSAFLQSKIGNLKSKMG